MANFPKMTLTNAGINLQTKALAGETITFTKIKMGDGKLNGSPVSPLTNLINSIVVIEDLVGTKKSTSDYEISAFFSNESITSGFWWREIGVFAKGSDGTEVLYCYANAGDAGDYIPVVTEQRIEKYLYVSFAVGNAENVTLNINQSDTFVPVKRKINGKPLNSDIVLTAEDIGISVGEDTISLYTHEYDERNMVHNFVGTGENGKVKIQYGYSAGDRFAINGTVYPCYTGEDLTDTLFLNRWVYFVFDGEQISIIAGGGNANTIGVVFHKTYTAGGGEAQVTIAGGEIDLLKSTDILRVYLDNLPIFENESYTISSDNTVLMLTDSLTAGQVLRIEITRFTTEKELENAVAMFNVHRENTAMHLTEGETVKSTLADFAEVAEWSDGNPKNEDRIGYFVCADLVTPGINMRIATSTDDIRGVTIKIPAFAAGASSDKYDADKKLKPQYDYVGFAGFIPVIDNGTCTVGERCMPADDGTAIPSTNGLGYQIIERADEKRIVILVEPGADAHSRFKDELDALSKNTMAKSVYDTNNNGIVDNAEKLDGHEADYFMPKTGDTFTGTVKARSDTREITYSPGELVNISIRNSSGNAVSTRFLLMIRK